MNKDFVLLEIAYQDVNASWTLYEANFYPQSLFYLQQSTEKAIKHLGISNGVITKNDLLNKIGHNADKIFKKTIGEFEDITGNSKTDFEKEYNHLSQIIRSQDLNIVKPEIEKIIFDYKHISIDEIEIRELIKSTLRYTNPEIIDKIESEDRFKEFFEKRTILFISKFPNYIKSVLILFVINSIISEYVSKVRYPNVDTFENPALIFTENHGLVKLLPLFLDNLAFAIKGITDYELIR